MKQSSIKLWILLLVVGGLGVAAFFLPIADWALELVEYVRGLGPAGAVLYGVIYAVSTVLLIPGSLLTIGAGFVYGIAGGVGVVLPGSVLGALAAFLVGRYFARDWVRLRVRRSRRLAALDDAVGERAFYIIFLLRLSPLVPFTLLNYFLGLTPARVRDYFAATATGMIPGIFLYVYIGSLITDAAQIAGGQRPDAGVAGQVLLWGGVAATAVVTVLISRLAKKKLDERIEVDV